MTYDNIPDELKGLNQWMVTRAGSKKPLSPHDLTADTWNDPACWGTFPQAVSAVVFGYAEHIGLVLRKENGIVAIDLDNKPDRPATEQQLLYHSDVLKAFGQSYTERSVSNSEENPCFHIFVKGVIPRSVNKEKIELRCDNFIVVTGDVDGDTPKPLLNGAEITKQLEGLAKFLGAYEQPDQLALSEPETRSDDDLWEVLRNSANNEKLFQPKMGGDSHTDYDIACWITKLTRNKEQAIRLFLRTPYAQGKKSDGKVLADSLYHVNRVIEKALNETAVPSIDISQIMPRALPQVVDVPKPSTANPMYIDKMPEGWCKEFAKFTLANSMSPLEEAAVFSSFLPVAGVGGRVFSASSTGLNQQFTLLALTGTGKDEAVNAAQKILTKVALVEPGVAMQAFVADDFASAPGIHRALVSQPVMFGYNKESGMWMERMSKTNPDEHMLMINSVMLDIYNLHGKFLKGRKYAKKDNDLDAVYSPTLSTLSVSTPRQFYDYMSIKMLDTGITGRELIFECEDTQAKSRGYSYVTPEAPRHVVEGIIRLAMMARRNIADVQFGPWPILTHSAEVDKLLDHWEIEYLKMQNADNGDVHRAIWSRANLKMRKLAGTLAVSAAMMYHTANAQDMQEPIMLVEHVLYAVAVVNYCSAQLEEKLTKRGVGNLYLKQEQVFEEAVAWYFTDKVHFGSAFSAESLERMRVAREDGVIFKSAIQQKCRGGSSAFAMDGAFERTFRSMLESGRYALIDKKQMQERYGIKRAEAFGRVEV